MVGSGGGAQSYVETRPIAPLKELVASVWIQRIASDAEPYTQRHIPSGGVELLCAIGEPPRVVSPMTRPVVEVLAPGTTVVGARLRPGAAPSVLGVPASELVDTTLALDELWGRPSVALGERLDAAVSPHAALAALQFQLAGRIEDAAAPDAVVAAAVAQLRWRAEGVASLTASLHFSERQLRRRCRAAVGLAPKALHRTLRFQEFLALAQHAIAQGKAPTDEGLALLAAEAGYADQPHLNRECVRLTGLPPRALLGAAEERCPCGHDHAASFLPLLRSRPSPRGA